MRKLFIIFLFLIIGIMLVSCSHREDTNGESDTSLTTLNDGDIVNGASSLSSGRTENKRNDRGEIKVNKFSGVQVIDSINVRDTSEVLTYKITHESGNLRAVLVKDGEIYSDLVIDGNDNSIALTESGKYDLKIAGESAKFEMEYKIK